MRALLEQMIGVGRDVTRLGLVVASGGNLSAREPGGDVCWVTATGTWLDRLDVDSFVPVSLESGAAVGGVLAPSSELALHLATYRARPDVTAIVHLHPQMAVLIDALGERIRLVTTDHAYYLGHIARVPFYPPGTTELADAAAAAISGGINCLVLAHHGCSVLGETVEAAHRRAVNLEEAARLTYHALLLTGRLGDMDIPEVAAGFRTI